ncbi:tRNA pseudouridine(55) synthase TruB [Ignavigranum ruoffiae]
MLDGILVVWKEAGMTSHDVVFKLRKILRMKKIGHTGTLDPEVEGVLVVCLGQATKLVEFLMSGHKIYQGEVTLGWSTETEDHTGKLVERKPVLQALDESLVDSVMATFKGKITQIPPYYSAVKVNGRKLYEYARQGMKVERPQRQIEIYQLNRLSPIKYDADSQSCSWKFDVECSKGTFVRTLAVDIGRALGYPAHMSALERLASSGYHDQQALTLAEIEQVYQEGRIEEYIQPIETALTEFPQLTISEQAYELVKHGSVLPADYFGPLINQPCCLIYQDRLVAMYYGHPQRPGWIKPRKMFR